jgi:hypothetical protein
MDVALTMVDIIEAGSVGIIIVVPLFCSNIVPGLVSLVVYLVVAVLSLYSWAAVPATYRLLQHQDTSTHQLSSSRHMPPITIHPPRSNSSCRTTGIGKSFDNVAGTLTISEYYQYLFTCFLFLYSYLRMLRFLYNRPVHSFNTFIP